MLITEDTMQPDVVKTSRRRPFLRTSPRTGGNDPHSPSLKDKAGQWADAHPWGVIGLCFGVAGILGYSLGARS